jgi:hypothetical protein
MPFTAIKTGSSVSAASRSIKTLCKPAEASCKMTSASIGREGVVDEVGVDVEAVAGGVCGMLMERFVVGGTDGMMELP